MHTFQFSNVFHDVPFKSLYKNSLFLKITLYLTSIFGFICLHWFCKSFQWSFFKSFQNFISMLAYFFLHVLNLIHSQHFTFFFWCFQQKTKNSKDYKCFLTTPMAFTFDALFKYYSPLYRDHFPRGSTEKTVPAWEPI